MLVGLTTGGDMFDQSLDALVNTAVTFGQNIIPAIKGALSGVGSLIEVGTGNQRNNSTVN